jgi:hypothetical protein
MTPEQIVREFHKPAPLGDQSSCCRQCDELWPCHSIQAIDALAAKLAEERALHICENKGAQEIMAQLEAERVALSINNTEYRVALDDKQKKIDALKAQVKELQETKRTDDEVYHRLRLQITEACGDPYALTNEGVAMLQARAEARSVAARPTKPGACGHLQYVRTCTVCFDDLQQQLAEAKENRKL